MQLGVDLDDYPLEYEHRIKEAMYGTQNTLIIDVNESAPSLLIFNKWMGHHVEYGDDNERFPLVSFAHEMPESHATFHEKFDKSLVAMNSYGGSARAHKEVHEPLFPCFTCTDTMEMIRLVGPLIRWRSILWERPEVDDEDDEDDTMDTELRPDGLIAFEGFVVRSATPEELERDPSVNQYVEKSPPIVAEQFRRVINLLRAYRPSARVATKVLARGKRSAPSDNPSSKRARSRSRKRRVVKAR